MTKLVSVVAVLTGLTASTAFADSCSLSGKTIIAYIENCGNVLGGYQCNTNCSKLVILGDKILFYNGLAAKNGDVYYFGRTVNMADTLRNDPELRSLLSDPNVSLSATGTASGNYQKFSLHYEALFIRSGVHRTTTGYTLTIRVSDCSTCEVESSTVFKSGRSGPASSRMKNQSCTILNRID